MLTFIATDLQLYKIFNIKQVSFFGTQCNEFTFIVDDGLLMASTSISGYGACETLIPVTVLYNDLATKLNEQHDCHITGRMADIFFLLHALHYTFLRAIATPGIRHFL